VEWRAKSRKAPADGYAWARPAIPWLETLTWIWGPSFDNKWHEEISDINQSTSPELRQFGLFTAFPPGK
jgi:hypothetical protein